MTKFWTRVLFLAGGLALTAGCSSTPLQILDPDTFYKRTVPITVNGKVYDGITVIPKSPRYDITLHPKGDINLLTIRNCHRDYGAKKDAPGWKLFGKDDQSFSYVYKPIKDFEDLRTCPLRIEVLSHDGQHSWAFIDFENPIYKLHGVMACNSKVVQVYGVGACQARKSTVQLIKFEESVIFAPAKPDKCEDAKWVVDHYEITVVPGECSYMAKSEEGEKYIRFTMIGHHGILLHEIKEEGE